MDGGLCPHLSMKPKYILAHMAAAEVYAQTSSANRLKVGALVVKQDTPIAIGINGTPRGVDNVCEDAEGHTLGHVRHAEIAALSKLVRSHESAEGASLFVTHMPCLACAYSIVDAGIAEVFYRNPYRDLSGLRWLLHNQVRVYSVTSDQIIEITLDDLKALSIA